MGFGIIEGNGKIDLNLIAKHYGLWMKGDYFDIGNTISGAISGIFKFQI